MTGIELDLSESAYAEAFIERIKNNDPIALSWMLEVFRLDDPYVKICPESSKTLFDADMRAKLGRVVPRVKALCLDAFMQGFTRNAPGAFRCDMWYWHVRALRGDWLDLIGALWLAHTISQTGITFTFNKFTAQEYAERMIVWADRNSDLPVPLVCLEELAKAAPNGRCSQTKAAALKVKNVLALEVWRPFKAS